MALPFLCTSGVEGRPLNYQILKNSSPTRDPVFTSKSTNAIVDKL